MAAGSLTPSSITNNSASFNATDISVIDVLPLDTLDQITCLSPCEPIFEEQEIPEPLGGTLVVTITRQLSWTVAVAGAAGAHTNWCFKGAWWARPTARCSRTAPLRPTSI